MSTPTLSIELFSAPDLSHEESFSFLKVCRKTFLLRCVHSLSDGLLHGLVLLLALIFLGFPARSLLSSSLPF
jgi:hypothetical protein